jgi:hypothetical protein
MTMSIAAIIEKMTHIMKNGNEFPSTTFAIKGCTLYDVAELIQNEQLAWTTTSSSPILGKHWIAYVVVMEQALTRLTIVRPIPSGSDPHLVGRGMRTISNVRISQSTRPRRVRGS